MRMSVNIKEILRVAASRNRGITIVVPTSSYGQWMKLFDKQKFREGEVKVLCCASDGDAQGTTITVESIFKTHINPMSYNHCNYSKHSKEFISNNLQDLALEAGRQFVGTINQRWSMRK